MTPEQKDALSAPLDRSHVKQREQAGRKFSYIEGWHAIAEANRIFGFDGWTRETIEIRSVSEAQRKIGKGQYQREGWSVSYIARVRVTWDGVVRDGVGAGHGIDADLGQAHESAIKEAETDAMKRALMTFGNPFGLALYDKEQREVATTPEQPGPPPEQIAAGIIKGLGKCDGLDGLKGYWKQVYSDVERLPADQRQRVETEKDRKKDAFTKAELAATP